MRKKLSVCLSALAAAVSLVAGCSSGSTSGGATSSAANGSAAKAALSAAYTGFGGDVTSYPSVAVPAGKTVGVISCGEAIAPCHTNAVALQSAAQAAGWKATIYDGKLTQIPTAVRQAIAAKVDVITTIGFNCSDMQPAYKEAHDAGILIVGQGGVDDCSPKLWGGDKLWLPDQSVADQWKAYGTLAADYAVGKTNAHVNAILLQIAGSGAGQKTTDAMKARVAQLGGGKVTKVISVSNQEEGDGSFVPKVISTLQANPSVNVLFAPNDAYFQAGLGQALIQAGMQDKLLVIGLNFQGDPSSFDLLRKTGTGQDAAVTQAGVWGCWGTIDTAIRLLAHQKPVYIKEPIAIVDATHNLPPAGQSFSEGVDFKALFLKAWGKTS